MPKSRLMFSVALAAFVCPAPPGPVAFETLQGGQAPPAGMLLRYGAPAADTNAGWQNYSLPIGNGHQGANIFGRIDKERLQLSEESLWTGGPISQEAHGPSASGVLGDYGGDAAIGNADREGKPLTPAYYRRARALSLGKAGDAAPPDPSLIAGSPGAAMYPMFPASREAHGNFQNFCEAYFHIEHEGQGIDEGSATDYVRWLDIGRAVAGVEYSYQGISYRREFFASYPARVVVARFSASVGGKVSFALRPSIPHAPTPQRQAGSTMVLEHLGKMGEVKTVGRDAIELSGALRQNGLKFAALFKVIPTGGSIVPTAADGVIKVEGADAVDVIISYGTDYINDYDKKYRTGQDPMKAVAQRAEAAASKGYAALLNEHIADYRALHGRVKLSLGGEPPDMMTDEWLDAYRGGGLTEPQRRALEELYFNYGRYLLIASSRPGALPANLQGVWNAWQVPPWSSDYHLNVNTQMNYWLASSANLKESLLPLVDYVDSLRKPGRATAKAIYGVGAGSNPDEPTGWVAHVSSNIFGFTGLKDAHNLTTSTGHAQYSPESAAWLCQNVYSLWQHYPDMAMLRDKIYPIMREAALFFSHGEILVRDPVSGRMVMAPSYSSEHGPMWGGATFQQQLLWELFTQVIEAADILGTDRALAGKLAALLPELGPAPIGPASGMDASGDDAPGIKEWNWETSYLNTASGPIPSTEPEHRHLSHLVGLFPGSLIGRAMPEWMAAAVGSLNRRGDAATGWSRGMKINLWARAGDGNRAYKIFDGLLASATLPNLWDHHIGRHSEASGGSTEVGIFQIDGNLGGAAGMIEMLAQSHQGCIEPLPALPDAWPSGSVSGLTMRGGFEVGMSWKDKALISMEIISSAGGACALKHGRPEDIRVSERGGGTVAVAVDAGSGTAVFQTRPGGAYFVSFKPVGS